MLGPEQHVIVYVPDHDVRARDLLLAQHKDKPRLSALVAAFAAGAQLQELMAWAVIVGASTLQAAEGVNLDRWGELVGEHRGGLDNEQYKRFIELRILVNTAFPNEDLVWQVVSGAVSPHPVRVFGLYPGGMLAHAYPTDPLSDSLTARLVGLVRDMRPAGLIFPVVEVLPDHMALDWEPDAPLISFLEAPVLSPVVSRLLYTGRGQA